MPQLLRNIQGEIHSTPIGSVAYVKSISAEIQREDYIDLNDFIAFLQNLSRTEYTQALTKPLVFGLVNQYNLTIETLEIDY